MDADVEDIGIGGCDRHFHAADAAGHSAPRPLNERPGIARVRGSVNTVAGAAEDAADGAIYAVEVGGIGFQVGRLPIERLRPRQSPVDGLENPSGWHRWRGS